MSASAVGVLPGSKAPRLDETKSEHQEGQDAHAPDGVDETPRCSNIVARRAGRVAPAA